VRLSAESSKRWPVGVHGRSSAMRSAASLYVPEDEAVVLWLASALKRRAEALSMTIRPGGSRG
jgi:hypothetical protein